jgi:tellurite resistance protein
MLSTHQATSRLKNFPVSWFAVIMGLSGFSIAWNKAEHILHLPFSLSPVLLGCTMALFVAFSLFYILKMIRYGDEVRDEIKHPVKIAFLPTYSISLLLLSIALLQIHEVISFWFWIFGTSLHFLFTLYVLSSWIHQNTYEIKHLNPAWFIPVVGNILVPVAGVHHAAVEISWFFFSVGLFFWPVLTAIIFYRLIFHQSLPERFIPTLFIFIAPPSVACISWYNLTGTIGAFGLILYFIALFFFILVLVQVQYFLKIKFYLSWWAYSFPIAALTIATLLMAKETGQTFFVWSGTGLIGALTILIIILVVQTAMAVNRRTICIEEEH